MARGRGMEPISTAPPLNQQQLRMTVCHARFPPVILIGDYKRSLSAHFWRKNGIWL